MFRVLIKRTSLKTNYRTQKQRRKDNNVNNTNNELTKAKDELSKTKSTISILEKQSTEAKKRTAEKIKDIKRLQNEINVDFKVNLANENSTISKPNR